MSKFKIGAKKEANPAALAAFAAGAETHDLAAPGVEPVHLEKTPVKPEKKTESILFRLSPSDLVRFNYVFSNTNIKSKQLLLEAIILPELTRREKELKG